MVRKHRAAALLILLAAGCALPGASPRAADLRQGEEAIVAAVREAARPVRGQTDDYDPLLELIGDSHFVLLGEQTHGTQEFYRERSRITRRLIREKGFTAVAVEGDWVDAHRVNRYVQGLDEDATPEGALAGFMDEFPSWMWGNTEMRELAAWLREHNRSRPADARAGFYGLDLYALWPSAQAVVASLERIDPAAAQRARERYRCFEGYRKDLHDYGRTAAARPNRSCQRVAVEQVEELEARTQAEADEAGLARREELFSALQNARVVLGAERYFRGLYRGGLSSWNLRDRHMADTLDSLARFLGAQGKPPKVVVWAHNTHLGDARVTQMGESGELNVGQLMRQRHDGDAVLVGFSTYAGTVTAASSWGERGRSRRLRPAVPGSVSELFHRTGAGDFLLLLRGGGRHVQALAEPRLQRAVGVVYQPATERRMHYFQARLSKQFDAVVHIDETSALRPLGT